MSETFYSNVYPVSWGDGMHEVVAGDPNQNETTNWIVNFFQVPNLGEFIKYDTMFNTILFCTCTFPRVVYFELVVYNNTY